MVTRILVKGIAIAVMIILAIGYTGVAKIIMIIASMTGIFSIYYTLSNYKKLKLEINMLILDKVFSGKEKFNLDEIQNWKEHRYYLRGHLQRSLILFFNRDTKIIISLYDDKDEFEKVFLYLVPNSKTLELPK